MVCEMEDTCCCLFKDVVGVRTWGIPRLVIIPVVALPVVSIEDSLIEVRKEVDGRFDDITLLDLIKNVKIGNERTTSSILIFTNFNEILTLNITPSSFTLIRWPFPSTASCLAKPPRALHDALCTRLEPLTGPKIKHNIYFLWSYTLDILNNTLCHIIIGFIPKHFFVLQFALKFYSSYFYA